MVRPIFCPSSRSFCHSRPKHFRTS
uniref:Uncharacterized protein n=1 Tax=Arundo donax TaxID=35708 RepID=A0A0A9HGY0_ARUDO